MKTTKEIQDEIAGIEERLQKLTCSDGLTAADIISLSREIDALKQEAAKLQTPSQAPPQDSTHYRTVPVSVAPKHPPRHKTKLTEGNIGRYGIGILASLLVLLAVGTMAGTLWAYIPSELKFIGIFIVGGICEFFGWRKLKKLGTANGFWTSITGLGAAICFAVFVFGQVIWGLYPSGLTAGLLLLWFIINFALATSVTSNVFYAITYLGGYICTCLVVAEGGMSVTTEAMIATAPLLIYLIGKIGFRISGNSILPILNTLFCLAEFIQIQGEMYIPSFELETLCASYRYKILPFALVLLSILILLDMANVWKENWRYTNIADIILPGIGSYVVSDACTVFSRTVLLGLTTKYANMWSWVLALLIITGCGYVYRNKLGKYLLATSFAVTGILIVMSHSLLGCASLLPAIFSLGLLFIPIIRKDNYGRAAGMIAYLFAFINVPFGIFPKTEFYTLLLWLQTVLLISIPVLNYILGRRQKDSIFPELETLVGLSCASFVIQPLAEHLGASNGLWVLVLATLALIYRYFMPHKPVSENPWEREIAMILLVIIYVFVCICAFLGGLIVPDTTDKIISTIILTMYSMVSVYKAVNERRAIYAILSAAFCNLSIFFILDMWDSNSANILISCAGLALAAVFIAIGFWKKKKNIRVTGLVVMIGYVLKIALFDIQEYAGSGGQIFTLLAGGLICFAVSFAYNRLSKLCGETDFEETTTKDCVDEPADSEKKSSHKFYL